MERLILSAIGVCIAMPAYCQPVFSRLGDVNVRVLNAQSLAPTAMVNGTPLSMIAAQASGALPASGGQLSGPLQAAVNLGTGSNTYGLGAIVTASGSGTNGPRTAQTGATFEAFKLNWDQTVVQPNVGEVDGVSVLTRQGGTGSDSSGILVNAQNTGLGFLSMTEMVSSAINTKDYTIKDGIDIQEGVIDEPNNNKIGVVYNMTYGIGSNAILVQNDSGAYWSNVFRYSKDGTVYFLVDGNGVITAAGLNVSGIESHTGNAFFSSVTQASRPVTSQQASYIFQMSDCGTLVRDTSTTSHIFTVPSGLPVGCVIDFIEASNNANATFSTTSSMTLEQVGSGTLSHQTIGQYSHVRIYIDTETSVLLQGDIK